ncbi:hypothetical protein S83_047403, partial [Arachis hypogaea]
GILNKRKLVAIDAGNRGYPPNKGLPRLCCGKIQSLGKHLLHILSSTPRHPNLIEHTSEKAKEAKDIQNRSQTEDETCIENTRMDRCAFHALCNMLKRGRRLEPSRNMGVEEMVAMFLHIIAHDVKIRVIKRQFVRSEETISRCHNLLLKKPQPFSQDRMDERWKWFKDCLGALDGTHIKVNVLEADKPRYRNRKGDITTNVLGVVAPDMQFIYVLAGWEGSAADSRVLRDALFRNGFSVPQ